jgi:hypothetical protein
MAVAPLDQGVSSYSSLSAPVQSVHPFDIDAGLKNEADMALLIRMRRL